MKEVKISVIVPVYKTEKYLKRCLESIVGQSLKEIEIIIVNDGSPDESYKIIEKFMKNDNRIKVINQKNSGLSVARNSGIKEACGEYILNIDSDDWIEQNYFKDIYFKAKNENLDILVTDIFWDYDNGKIKYQKDLNIEENRVIDSKLFTKKLIEGEVFPAVWNKLFKRQLYHENEIFHPEGISLGEDLFVTSKLAFFSKRIGKINRAYVHYIQNPQSIMNNNAIKKVYDLIQVYESLDKFYKNKIDLDISKIRGLNMLLFNSNYNPDEKLYRKAIGYYIELNKKKVYKSKSRRFHIYSFILNKFPTFNMFKIIYKFNKLGLKLKSIFI